MFTLDILDTNIVYMGMLGYKDLFMTLPILHEEEGNLQLACFTWQAKRGQVNVPRPEHVCITTLKGNVIAIKPVEALFDNKDIPVPNIIKIKYPQRHHLKSTAGLLDSILLTYLMSNELSGYEYLYYLERLYAEYPVEFRPLFKQVNISKYNIDSLEG